MLSFGNKKIFSPKEQTIKHANSCDYSENSYYKKEDTIIDVLVCAYCGKIYCSECFDSKNNTYNLDTAGNQTTTSTPHTLENSHLTNSAQHTNHAKCTQLFCALFDIGAKELIDASQAFCGHYSHNDDQDECFVCHETSCINCRVEYLARFYCNNCFLRCLFCANPTEISKAQGCVGAPDHTRKKIHILQNSICAKCGLPACDDCLDYDFLCPGCSGEQSG